MDWLQIKQLKAYTTLGVYDWEQTIQTLVILDIRCQVDSTSIASSDDIEQTVDYDALCQSLTQWLSGKKHRLIETLANNIAHFLLDNYPTSQIELTLAKPGATEQASEVSIHIKRSKD